MSKTEGGVTTNFSYNFDDQLVTISGPTSVSFVYDGLGRRVSRTAGGVTTIMFFDRIRPTAEKLAGAMVAHYTFGAKELVAWDDGTRYEYNMPDTFGSTRQVTDSGQAVTASYLFEGFGILLSQTGSANNPYRFAGIWGYRDNGDAGLLLVGARYYDPQVGRFITADTWLGLPFDPQSLHRYVYVEGDPINRVNPSGRWDPRLVAAGVLVAALAGAAAYFFFGTDVPEEEKQKSIRVKQKQLEEEQRLK